MTKKNKRQRSDDAAIAEDSGGDNISSPSPKGIDKTPNNKSDDMNSNNTNFTPSANDDPSTWSKSKRKRMRQKRNKAAKKLLLASGDTNSAGRSGGKQDNVNGNSSNIMNSPSKQTASAMQKMNMNSPNNSVKSSITHSNASSDEDSNSKKRHKKNPDIDNSNTHASKESAGKSIDISDHTVSNEDSRSPNRKEKQKNDTADIPTSNIETGEDTPTKKKRKKKKKKKSPVKEGSSTTNDKEDVASISSKPNSNNKQTTNNNKMSNTTNSTTSAKPASPKLKISLPKQSQMSTLQKSFLERLTSSRFRELNEELYTHSSQHSFDYFTANPELFDQYHVGFRKQVEDWPVNPVDVIYKKIVSSWRKDRGDKMKNDSQEKEQQTVVADFGCGDAKLGERLLSLQIGKDGQSLTPSVSSKSKKKKQNQQQQSSTCPFKVHSFDLVSGGNKLVTPADMANLPLEKECIDVGVYSLALMGTNVADFVREAWRVLKFNGVLRVAEVRSRFETAAAGEDNDTNKHGGGGKRGKLNNGKKSLLKKTKNSKPTHSSSGGDEYNTPQPIMLLDEFLALMERCGFECTNMDRSNKMFLFMDFVKVDGSNGLSEKERFTAKPCIYKRR